MGKTNIYARNVTWNWITYVVRLIVFFFMSPFIIKSLGPSAYGIWCLLVSLTGYLGLLDVGIMTGTSRYINLYLGRNDQENVNRVVSTALFVYLGISIGVFILVSFMSPFLFSWFKAVPDALRGQAQLLLYVFCGNISISFFSSILRQLLAAKNRFDLMNIAGLSVLAISTVSALLALKMGYGIVALGLIHLISNVLGCAILFSFSKGYGPIFRINFNFVTRNMFSELLRFGLFAFIADVGIQLILYTDSLVIGIFMGVSAITFYNVGFMVADHGSNLLKQARNVLIPDILKSTGSGNLNESQWLVIKSSRFLMLFGVPMFVGFIALGPEFISLWMGPGYEESGWVLRVIAVAQFAAISSFSFNSALVGFGQIRFLAFMALTEGILNLCLSILFISWFKLGIIGVALGTLIPMVTFTGVWVQVHTSRYLQMKFSTFARATFLRWGAAALLFAIPCFAATQFPLWTSWLMFGAKVSILMLIYIPIAFYILLTKEDQVRLLSYLKIVLISTI